MSTTVDTVPAGSAAILRIHGEITGGSEGPLMAAYGGVAPTPLRAKDAENVLMGAPFDRRLFDRARDVLVRSFRPISDVRASAAYRLAMVTSLFERFLWECAS